MQTLTNTDDTNQVSSTASPENLIIPSNNTTMISIQFWEDNDPDEPDPFDTSIEAYLAGDDDHDTPTERAEHIDPEWLESLESEIENQMCAVNGFREVGGNLLTIKELGMYRATHTTFAAYCKDKFGLNHIKDRPNTPAAVQVPRELADSIKAFINEDKERVRAMAYLITALAKQSPEKQ